MKRFLICMALLLVLAVSAAADGPSIPMVVTLEGTEYTMPCSVSELMDDGWTLYNYEPYEYLAFFEMDENDELYDQFYHEHERVLAWKGWYNEGYDEEHEAFWDQRYQYTSGIKNFEVQSWVKDELDGAFEIYWYNSKVEECQAALAIDLEKVLVPGEAYGKCMMVQADGKEVIVFVRNLGDAECKVMDCAVTMFAIESIETIIRNPARLIYEGMEVGVTSKDNVPAWTLEYRGNIGELDIDKFDYTSGLRYALNVGAFDPTYHEEMKELSVSVGRFTPHRSETLTGTYDAPPKLEEDWTSGTVMMNGKLYRLPVPIEEVLKDGWIVDTEMVYPYYERKGGSGRMTKGNMEVDAEVFFEKDGYEYYEDDVERWIYGDIVGLGFRLNDNVEAQVGAFYLGMTEEEMLEACRTMYGTAPEREDSIYTDHIWYSMYVDENGVRFTEPEDLGEDEMDYIDIYVEDSVVSRIWINIFPK